MNYQTKLVPEITVHVNLYYIHIEMHVNLYYIHIEIHVNLYHIHIEIKSNNIMNMYMMQ